MKKILFDLSASQPIHGKDFHGGSEHAKAVFYKLIESQDADTEVEAFYNNKKNIDPGLLNICKENNVIIHNCLNNKDVSALLSKDYNVFYSALPYHYSDIIIPQKTKFIYTIHGLRFLEYPADRYELKYKKISLVKSIKLILFSLFPKLWKYYITNVRYKRFNKLFSLTKNQTIITVSNHSKYSLFYFFPKLDSSKIKVFYSPEKKYITSHENESKILDSFSLEKEKYILLICGDRSEKGAYRACISLYELVKRKALPNDIKIIFLGVSFSKHYLKLTKKNNRFIFYNYVSSEELEVLYKNAHLFMFPTLNEGFGCPPLEAMKYGTLCACSANSSVTEVCGNAVLYFNPFDKIEMGIRVLQSFDENIKKEKKEKMDVQYKTILEKQLDDFELYIREIKS